MKRLVTTLLALLPLCLAAQQSFEIKGKVGNMNNPFKVYLVYYAKGKLVVDSSMLHNGVYLFKGQMDSVRAAGLVLSSGGLRSRPSNLADMKTFYMHNDTFTVTSPDSMRSSIVAGSHTNDSAVAADMQKAIKSMQETKPEKEWHIGDPAPLFQQPDSSGKMVNLADFRGKIVLVDFWASWCGPCRAESPNLVKAYRKYHSRGFEIISVSVDDSRTAWLEAVKKDNMTWINVSDLKTGSDNEATKLYSIQTVPQNFLIDKDGKLLGGKLMGDALEKKLDEIFNK